MEESEHDGQHDDGLFSRGRRFLKVLGSFIGGEGGVEGTTVSRAECTAILNLEENAVKAAAVREQSVVLSEKKADNASAVRAHMAKLRQQRLRSQERIQDNMEDVRESRAMIVSEKREQLEMNRLKRADKQRYWEARGRMLSKQHAEMLEKMREAEAAQQAASREECREMSEQLKLLTKATRADVARQKDELHDIVKARGCGDTLAKQVFANERYDRAMAVKVEEAQLRERRYANEVEYLANALAAKAAAKVSLAEAQTRRQAERAADAAEQRLYRERLKVEKESVKKAEVDRKRAIVQTVQHGKRTPAAALEEQLMSAATLGFYETEGALGSVSRYFGFRKRGANQELSSQVSL